MRLLVNSEELEYISLNLHEAIARVSTLECKTKKEVKVNSKVIVPYYFEGIIVSVEEDNGIFNFIAFENTWKLQGIPSRLDHYTQWKLDHILNGYATTELHKTFYDSTPKINVRWYGLSGKAVLTGIINGVHVVEYLSLVETTDGKLRKSRWCTDANYVPEPADIGWHEITGFHVEGNDNKPIENISSAYATLYNSSTSILKLSGTNYMAAHSDGKGHYSNGILYDTDYSVNYQVDDQVLDLAKFEVSGETALDILENICEGPMYSYNDVHPFKASFYTRGNTMYIRQAGHKLKEIFREDEEIGSYTYDMSIENLVNKFSVVTNRNVSSKSNDASISKYGLFEKIEDAGLDDEEARRLIEYNISRFSMPEEELSITTHNKRIFTGDKIYVDIPSLGIKGYKTVQEIDRSFSSCSDDIEMIVRLTEYTPVKKLLEKRANARHLFYLDEIFVRGAKKLLQRHLSSDFIEFLSGDKPSGPRFIVASAILFKGAVPTTTNEAHAHTIEWDVTKGSSIDLT